MQPVAQNFANRRQINGFFDSFAYFHLLMKNKLCKNQVATAGMR